ncbi:hypothetical protein CCZ01_09850, partial [Helicobacter monodelphidis]|uniref:LPD3 domain-containing protein n=1 Tax=Helicobacter sp. 15-1451 TaxID=2004995 RepID=UPI000DCBC8C7
HPVFKKEQELADKLARYETLRIEFAQEAKNAKKGESGEVKEKVFELHTDGVKTYKQLNEEFKATITPILNTDITNKETGIIARISSNESKKMISKKAIDKTLTNGFSKEEHFKVAENIKYLFVESKLREKHPDEKGRKEVANILRFEKEVELDGNKAIAKITAFEKYEGNNKIYSLELESLEKPISSSQSANKADMADFTKHTSEAPHNPSGEFIKSDTPNSTTNKTHIQDDMQNETSQIIELAKKDLLKNGNYNLDELMDKVG